MDQAAAEMDASVIYRLPRHPLVQEAEAQGKTVVEAFPDSDMAEHYKRLALRLLEGREAE